MEDKMMEIAFGIIGFAGEAKFIAKESISKAKTGEIEEAKDMLNQARETLTQAHRFQTELITKEANGEKTEMSVVLVHSQDHLMTTMSYLDLAEEFIDMYEIVHSK